MALLSVLQYVSHIQRSEIASGATVNIQCQNIETALWFVDG